MSKFFASPKSIKNGFALITADEAHHIVDVMRLKVGDPLEFFDGTGKVYEGRIASIESKTVKIALEREKNDLRKREVEITLVQAVPKKNKMEYIVAKCAELGIDAIVPAATARTIVRLEKERAGRKNARWQKIGQEAAKQCGRSTIPTLSVLSPWEKIITSAENYDLRLLPCLSPRTIALKEALRIKPAPKKIIYCIGPEGGFTPTEIEQAEKNGFIPVSLGGNVLKSDTAAIATLAMINYELGI